MTNESAIGYMILAAKALDIAVEDIRKIAQEMQSQMDFKTEECAEKAYKSFWF